MALSRSSYENSFLAWALNVRRTISRIINGRRRSRKEKRDQGANRKKVGSEIKD
jgi:hypothetical protein